MSRKLLYVELKTGYGDDGPAWIGLAETSRSGRSVYFNGRCFMRGRGISGNHFDVETHEEYWISGVKRRGSNRHACGTGPVLIDEDAVPAFLQWKGLDHLDSTGYQVFRAEPTDIDRFTEMMNLSSD